MSKLYDSYATLYSSEDFSTPNSSQVYSSVVEGDPVQVQSPTSNISIERTPFQDPFEIYNNPQSNHYLQYHKLENPPHIPTPTESPKLEPIPEDMIYPVKRREFCFGFFNCFMDFFKCTSSRKK